jgi:divalent metal cation (Fe/Co/Zn/Cd) transporter
LAQTLVFLLTDSVALLADLIHNFGDALTAVPIGIAFALRSHRADYYAGLAIVLAIFVSACVAGFEATSRLINPSAPDHLLALAAAGLIGFGGNLIAAQQRSADSGWKPRAGRCPREPRRRGQRRLRCPRSGCSRSLD